MYKLRLSPHNSLSTLARDKEACLFNAVCAISTKVCVQYKVDAVAFILGTQFIFHCAFCILKLIVHNGKYAVIHFSCLF